MSFKDMVEVVRCSQCKCSERKVFYRFYGKGMRFNDYTVASEHKWWCRRVNRYVEEDHYCSYGAADING